MDEAQGRVRWIDGEERRGLNHSTLVSSRLTHRDDTRKVDLEHYPLMARKVQVS